MAKKIPPVKDTFEEIDRAINTPNVSEGDHAISTVRNRVMHHRTQGKKYKFVKAEQKETRKLNLKLFLLLGIVVVIAAVYFMFFSKPETKPISIIIPNITKPNITDNTCNDDCLLQKALETKEIKNCEEIIDKNKKQDCVSGLAENSLEICLKLTDYSIKKSCVEKHAQNNVELCNNLETNDVKECVEKIEPCYYVKNDERPLCSALAKNNYSYCQKEEECIFAYAKTKKDPEACSEIKIMVKYQACSSVALNKDICDGLPYKDDIESCRSNYATRTDQMDRCQWIAKDSSYALGCYLYFATKNNDEHLCDSLDITRRWDCYRNYSKVTGDLDGCIAIDRSAPITKAHCFIDVSKKYGLPYACEYLTFEPGARENCFKAGIVGNNNLKSQNCANLTSEAWTLRCYTNTAQLEHNINVCDSLQEPEDENFCRSNYKELPTNQTTSSYENL